MATTPIPDEATVFGYFRSLSNWGRWGDDDQLGTLNLVTPAKTLQAARLVQEGVSVTCCRPIVGQSASGTPSSLIHNMMASGEGLTPGAPSPAGQLQVSMDFIGMAFHGGIITHVDALAHIFWNGQMYNGRPATLVTMRQGATVESIELLHQGVVTRGVLLDVDRVRGVNRMGPRGGVFPDDLEAAEQACNIQVESGDVLLIRTGSYRRRLEQGPWNQAVGRAGIHAACLPWFRQRDIAMLGSDTANDGGSPRYDHLPAPVHQVGIVALGLWLIDNCDLEELAAACAQRNRWEFLLSLGPLPIHNGTGSPVNPIAVF